MKKKRIQVLFFLLLVVMAAFLGILYYRTFVQEAFTAQLTVWNELFC